MSCQCLECQLERENTGDPFLNNLTEEDFMQDNSWYEKGELPPVGWHGETTWGKKVAWHECVILPNNNIAIKRFHVDDEWYVDLIDDSYEFRTIKSDREKAIEEMKEIVNSVKADVLTQDLFLGALYDAGFKKADK